MRIAIVMFPITEVGGINSYNWVLMQAWRKMGHEVNFYHATLHGQMRKLDTKKPVLLGRYIRLPGQQLAYEDKADLRYAKKILNEHDLVIFAHQAPHLDMRGKGEMKWKKLYELNTIVMNIWHDNFWYVRYPALEDVAQHVKVNLLANMNTWNDSAQSYPGYFVHAPIPVDTTSAGLYLKMKKERVVWLPQWKVWKGIHPFMQSLQWIPYPVHLYNSGIEYHYMRKETWWNHIIGSDEYKPKGKRLHGPDNIIIKGPRILTKIPGILKRANVSVDLSGFADGKFEGQTTCVHFESMVYGAVLVCDESQVRVGPIPKECCFPVHVNNPRELAADITSLMHDPRLQKKIAKNAVEWVQSYVSAEKIAGGILKLAESKTPTVKKATLGKMP